MYTCLVDSGTSMTRIRLFQENQLVDAVIKHVGAADVAVSGTKKALVEGLESGISQLKKKVGLADGDISAVILTGMVTSNNGLKEIPHVRNTVPLNDFSMIEEKKFTLAGCPVFYIPGVKVENGPLEEKDMMRGEECEIIGYLQSQENVTNNMVFIHYGSHHKIIRVENNHIVSCKTSMTGEIMALLSNHSILKNSIVDLANLEQKEEWVLKGFRQTFEQGFGRTVFSTRVLDVMEGNDKNNNMNFLLGALLALDYQFMEPILSNSKGKVVLYGRQLFPMLFRRILHRHHSTLKVEIVNPEKAGMLSTQGALAVYSQYLRKKQDFVSFGTGDD